MSKAKRSGLQCFKQTKESLLRAKNVINKYLTYFEMQTLAIDNYNNIS